MKTAFTSTERSAKLEELAAALRDYHAAMNASQFADAERLWAGAGKAEDDYFGRLPRIAMSCCPFDGEPVIRTFDPFGLDGPWWRADAAVTEVPTCPHFCFVRGAVNFNGKRPRGGDFEAHVGPEVPYVIPRILEQAGMTAVVSRTEMTAGHTVYLIAYFAQRRPPVQQLAANWPRTLFVYTTALRERRWRADEEACDFDLEPWIQRGKIRWCNEGENGALAEGGAFPYLNLKGSRERRVVRGERVWGVALAEEHS